jgi:hypothetical protein
MRTIECKEVLNYRTGNAGVFRLDTGERVEERPLTGAERQMKFDLKHEEEEEGEEEEAPEDADLTAANSEVGM